MLQITTQNSDSSVNVAAVGDTNLWSYLVYECGLDRRLAAQIAAASFSLSDDGQTLTYTAANIDSQVKTYRLLRLTPDRRKFDLSIQSTDAPFSVPVTFHDTVSRIIEGLQGVLELPLDAVENFRQSIARMMPGETLALPWRMDDGGEFVVHLSLKEGRE